jgi:hypothetical protein
VRGGTLRRLHGARCWLSRDWWWYRHSTRPHSCGRLAAPIKDRHRVVAQVVKGGGHHLNHDGDQEVKGWPMHSSAPCRSCCNALSELWPGQCTGQPGMCDVVYVSVRAVKRTSACNVALHYQCQGTGRQRVARRLVSQASACMGSRASAPASTMQLLCDGTHHTAPCDMASDVKRPDKCR